MSFANTISSPTKASKAPLTGAKIEEFLDTSSKKSPVAEDTEANEHYTQILAEIRKRAESEKKLTVTMISDSIELVRKNSQEKSDPHPLNFSQATKIESVLIGNFAITKFQGMDR